ncbi:MAG: YbbR-like domain-containing protein [Chlorobi bacterium]|nr:YbbR-like domain-containing protein [Chlorobiota bacterium]
MSKRVITISLVVMFSIILWIFVSLSRDYFTNVKAAIQIVDIPEGYTVGYVSNEDLVISLKGQGWLLAPIVFGKDQTFNLSASNQTGAISVSLRDNLNLNNWLKSDVQIVGFNPDHIGMEIEKIAQKVVTVVPVVNLQFQKGFDITSDILLVPDTVRIFGPKSFVENIDSVYTEATTISDLHDNFTGYLQLKPLKGISFAHKMVKISFKVQKIVEREFLNVVVSTLDVPPRQEIILIPSKIKVILKGGIDILTSMNSSDISASITFKQAVEDTVGALFPKIILPEKTRLLKVEPEKLNYKIKRY